MTRRPTISILFFFNDTATTEIYTLSLHDALPISVFSGWYGEQDYNTDARYAERNVFPITLEPNESRAFLTPGSVSIDRNSTRLNSSHSQISYAVFCLKKKKRICSLRIASMCHNSV